MGYKPTADAMESFAPISSALKYRIFEFGEVSL